MSFADNYGMMPHAVEYKGKQYELDEAANALIHQIGWDDKEKREDLAMAWVTQVELASLTILHQKPDDAPHPSFHEPKVIRFDDGSVEVTVWVRHPVGMFPARDYSQHKFTIDDGGKLTEERLKSESVKF